MKITERIIDFIKSFMYYPTMKKYFDDSGMSDCNHWRDREFGRFEYAWWHCHVGKLKE